MDSLLCPLNVAVLPMMVLHTVHIRCGRDQVGWEVVVHGGVLHIQVGTDHSSTGVKVEETL